jgi:hypothetical protein
MSRTLGSGKTFFIQYLTKYYMLLKKKDILIAVIGCVASRLNSKVPTFHNMFHIQCKGYICP